MPLTFTQPFPPFRLHAFIHETLGVKFGNNLCTILKCVSSTVPRGGEWNEGILNVIFWFKTQNLWFPEIPALVRRWESLLGEDSV